MKFFITFLILISCLCVAAQNKTCSKDSTYADIIYVNRFNEFDIHSEDFYYFIRNKIDSNKNKINDNSTYPKIYFTNRDNTQYLEIFSAPDIGFGQFYSIGYTKNSHCSYCGSYLGKLNFEKFIVNDSITLGSDLKSVGRIIHLNYFRSFSYKETKYYYYEKNIDYQSIPLVPQWLYYYKTKKNKISEIGFGHGFVSFNPMFQPE